MKCVFCGTDNPDGARFCKKCGKRLDGMTACPSCCKDTPADGDFCIYCGADLKGAAVSGAGLNKFASNSAGSGEVGAYPAANIRESSASAQYCGAVNAVRETATADYAAHGEDRAPFVAASVMRVLKVAAEAFAVLAALVGAIFVFFIGYTVSADVSGATIGFGGGGDIFYFFGDVYKDIESVLESSGLGSQSFANYSYMTGAVVGTVCSALALAATVMLFIATVVRYVRKLLKHTQKSATDLAAATFFSYVCGVALFMLCTGGSVSVGGEEVVTALNGVSIAGLVLGGVFIVASVISSVVCGADGADVRQTVINGVCGAASTVFLLVIAGVAAYGVFGLAMDAGNGRDMVTTLGMTELFIMLATLSRSYYVGNIFGNMYNSELVVNIVLLVFAIAFCVFAVISLSGIFSGFGKKMGGRRAKILVVSGACAVVAGIMMIVSDVLFVNWASEYISAGECRVDVTVPVVVMVFGVLLILGTFIYYALMRREEKRERYGGVQQFPRYGNGL